MVKRYVTCGYAMEHGVQWWNPMELTYHARMDVPRVDHTDPLPVYQEPTSRWATPYITYVDGQSVHACALRMDVHLSTREILGGCLTIVYGETPEALQQAMDREDHKSAEVLNQPPLWSETGSGSPANSVTRGGGGAAGSSVGF